VDIAVLKIHYNNKYTFYLESNEERESFQDVMVKHGLSYEQYLSVRENLRRLGLLEITSEDNVEENLKELQESISKMKSHYDRVLNGKRSKKIKEPKIKLKVKEKMNINKFGRNFYEFFSDNFKR